MYISSYYLTYEQISVAAIHLLFQGYVPMSPVVVYITADDCTLIHQFYSYKVKNMSTSI
jgi:hypothetical protein